MEHHDKLVHWVLKRKIVILLSSFSYPYLKYLEQEVVVLVENYQRVLDQQVEEEELRVFLLVIG
jgi:hypothetical protein